MFKWHEVNLLESQETIIPYLVLKILFFFQTHGLRLVLIQRHIHIYVENTSCIQVCITVTTYIQVFKWHIVYFVGKLKKESTLY